jgi:hypothetical protein
VIIASKRIGGVDFTVRVLEGVTRYTVDSWIVPQDAFQAALSLASAATETIAIPWPEPGSFDLPMERVKAATALVKKALG